MMVTLTPGSGCSTKWLWIYCSHTSGSVTDQYNLLAERQWCSAADMVIGGKEWQPTTCAGFMTCHLQADRQETRISSVSSISV